MVVPLTAVVSVEAEAVVAGPCSWFDGMLPVGVAVATSDAIECCLFGETRATASKLLESIGGDSSDARGIQVVCRVVNK